MTLHGVVVETESDAAVVEMAVCFIEEYARLGFDADRIQRMFHTQGYAGPAMALQILGEQRIRELIADEMALRGPRPLAEGRSTTTSTSAGISLPVLDPGR
jgi:hypothetical protein